MDYYVSGFRTNHLSLFTVWNQVDLQKYRTSTADLDSSVCGGSRNGGPKDGLVFSTSEHCTDHRYVLINKLKIS